jgi:ribosomal protein S18 acetylase RimI-like enzyme
VAYCKKHRSEIDDSYLYDFKRTILSVNGENDRAQALYMQEGFKQVEAVVCYQSFLG